MPLDAICVSALTADLLTLKDMRIDKIHQPEKDLFIFSLRARSTTAKLLLSAGVGSARVHLTQMTYENPQTPPMFCMLLRKHLSAARISSVSSIPYERAIDIVLDSIDDLGEPTKKHLICEMLGKYSNIILCDHEMRIIDCFRRVDSDMSELRPILPGLFYRTPPAPRNKTNPFTLSETELSACWDTAPPHIPFDDWLLRSFFSLSPLICREISLDLFGTTDIHKSDIRIDNLPHRLHSYFTELESGSKKAIMLCEGDRPVDFYCTDIKQYRGIYDTRELGSFSELLDTFYSERERQERLRQRSAALTKTVKTLRDRVARKLAVQIEEKKATATRQRQREFGDIIKANLHRMTKGMELLHAPDFYAEDAAEISIKLDPKLSPQQNAARYYKTYTKLKNAEGFLTSQIENAETELDYLESVLESLDRVTGERDINEIREELKNGGYLRKENRKHTKAKEPGVLSCKTEDGFEILVGRNNIQNDRLTTRLSSKSDIWLHTQKIHGAHVVIRSKGTSVPPAVLEEAAKLAVRHSKARYSSNVPVDYTLIKHVRKPPAAKPGMVVYTDFKTIFVSP